MYKDAINVALNALAVLEDTIPDDSRQYRRLLPALAVHFARSGNSLTEKGILNLVAWAREENVPLSNLFNSARGQAHQELKYETIAQRLSKAPPPEMTHERALSLGSLEYFRQYDRKFMYTSDQYRAFARQAATRGHTDICRYLVSRTTTPLQSLAVAMADAVRHRQYHLVHTFLQDETLDVEYLQGELRGVFDDEKYSEYAGFKRLYSDFQKSSSNVRLAHFTGLEASQHVPLRLKPYLEIRGILKAEISNIRDLNIVAFKATMLFQSKHNLLRYFDRWGQPGLPNPLSSLLKDIDAPVSRFVDWSSWGDALIKYGPQMNYPIQFAQQLRTPVKNEDGVISLRLTRQRIWDDFFPHDRKYGPVGDLCYEHGTKMIVLEKALTLWKHAAKRNPSPSKSIPDIDIDGSDFDLPGYRLTKIPYSDPRIMFLGYYTGCCEKMGDHFEPSIVDALSTRKSGFYILTQNGEIKAHSWVWRGEGGQLIIDGWESKDPEITDNVLEILMEKIGTELSSHTYEEFQMTDILLGRSNAKFNVENIFEQAHEIATRYVCEWYYDDDLPNQWLVNRIKKPIKFDIYDAHKRGMSPD